MEESHQDEKDNDVYKITWSEVAILAILSSPTQSLPVNKIYSYTMNFFPQKTKGKWQNSIRHNISMEKVKVFGCSGSEKKADRSLSYHILPDLNDKIQALRNKGLCLLFAIRIARFGRDIHGRLLALSKEDPSLPYYLRKNFQNITLNEFWFQSKTNTEQNDSDHIYGDPIVKKQGEGMNVLGRSMPMGGGEDVSAETRLKIMQACRATEGSTPSEEVHTMKHGVKAKPVAKFHSQQFSKPIMSKEGTIDNPTLIRGTKNVQPVRSSIPPSNQNPIIHTYNTGLMQTIHRPIPMQPTSHAPFRFKAAPSSMIPSKPITAHSVPANKPVHGVISAATARQPYTAPSGLPSTISQSKAGAGVFSTEKAVKRHVAVQNLNKGHPNVPYPPHYLASQHDPQKSLNPSLPNPEGKWPVRQLQSNKFSPYQKQSSISSPLNTPQHNPVLSAILTKSPHPPPPISITLSQHIIHSDPSTTSSQPLDLTKAAATAEKLSSVKGIGPSLLPNAPSFAPVDVSQFPNLDPDFVLKVTNILRENPPQSLPLPAVQPILPSSVSSIFPPQSIPSFHSSQSVIHHAPPRVNPADLFPPPPRPTNMQPPSIPLKKTTSAATKVRKVVTKTIWTNQDLKGTQQTQMDNRVETKDEKEKLGGTTPPAPPPSTSILPSTHSSQSLPITGDDPVDMTIRIATEEERVVPTAQIITVPTTVASQTSLEVRVETYEEVPITTASSIPTALGATSKIIVDTREEMDDPTTSSTHIQSLTVLQIPSENPTERKEVDGMELIEEPTEVVDDSQPMELSDSQFDTEDVECGEEQESPIEINTPVEMETAMNDIEQDISSMDIRKETIKSTTITQQVTPSVHSTEIDLHQNTQKEILEEQGDLVRSIPIKSVPPPPQSTQPLPIPRAPLPSSSSSSLLSEELSKSCFTKAHHTTLPAPMKRKEVQEIGLINPKLVHRPVILNRPVTSIAPSTMKVLPKKIVPILSRGGYREAPKSQIALSLMERKKEDEVDGMKDKISRRRAEKDKFRAAAKADGTSPPPFLDNEDGERDRNEWIGIGGIRDYGNREEQTDEIIFTGTAKRKKIKFLCETLAFEDELGFAADKSERLDYNGRPIEMEDEFDEDNCPWGDSVVGYMTKATEKERAAERAAYDPRTEKQKRADRRKELKQLKKEGIEPPKLENDKRKKKQREFDPKYDRFLEHSDESERRREGKEYRSYLEQALKHRFQRSTPFYLHTTIDGIQRGTPYPRENQRLQYVQVNPNPNLPWILSGGHNRSILLHNYLSGTIENTHRPHFTYANDAAWSYCGRFFIATGTDKLVAIVETDGFPTVKSRIYAESVPIAARFTENGNFAVVALKSGILTVMDWRIEAKSAIVRKITGMPEITCMDTNPMNWARTVFGCENGLVTEYDFFEDHRRSTTDSYFQYNVAGIRPIFSCLPFDEYDDYCDQSPIKSIRYCSSEHSSCIDDIVLTRRNFNEKIGDTAYKFSPGRTRPVVTYTPPEGFNLSCAAFAYNNNKAHKKRYNSCENYVVTGTEEGTVVAFHAETGELLRGGTHVLNDSTQVGNNEMRYVKDLDPMATMHSYVPVRKYFPYEKVCIDPNLATRITAIDAVPDPFMGTFIVGGWGVNPIINIYKFHDYSEKEHLLND